MVLDEAGADAAMRDESDSNGSMREASPPPLSRPASPRVAPPAADHVVDLADFRGRARELDSQHPPLRPAIEVYRDLLRDDARSRDARRAGNEYARVQYPGLESQSDPGSDGNPGSPPRFSHAFSPRSTEVFSDAQPVSPASVLGCPRCGLGSVGDEFQPEHVRALEDAPGACPRCRWDDSTIAGGDDEDEDGDDGLGDAEPDEWTDLSCPRCGLGGRESPFGADDLDQLEFDPDTCPRCHWELQRPFDEHADLELGEGGECAACGAVQAPFGQCLSCGGPVEPSDGSYRYHFGEWLTPVALAARLRRLDAEAGASAAATAGEPLAAAAPPVEAGVADRVGDAAADANVVAAGGFVFGAVGGGRSLSGAAARPVEADDADRVGGAAAEANVVAAGCFVFGAVGGDHSPVGAAADTNVNNNNNDNNNNSDAIGGCVSGAADADGCSPVNASAQGRTALADEHFLPREDAAAHSEAHDPSAGALALPPSGGLSLPDRGASEWPRSRVRPRPEGRDERPAGRRRRSSRIRARAEGGDGDGTGSGGEVDGQGSEGSDAAG